MLAAETAFVDYDTWERRLPALMTEYRSAQPFPYLVLDGLLHEPACERLEREFPTSETAGWIHYFHVNERKVGNNRRELLPAALNALIDELNSRRFVSFLSALSGIPELLADPELEGGGLHRTARGGTLNIHSDFTGHPHRRQWRRRINMILYLNSGWRDEYGGHIELWDRDMARCMVRAAPTLNRCLIFNTGEHSFHGHPEALRSPPSVKRKSLALYYYTDEGRPVRARSTHYRPRPGDRALKRLAIALDNQLLSIYFRLKRRFLMGDRLAGTVLAALNGRRRDE